MKQSKSILNQFIETALWSTHNYDGVPLDSKYTMDDVSQDFKNDAQKLIDDFIERALPLMDETDPDHIGHDLWLTIEGHGAGFWGGDYKNGDALTELCEKHRDVWGDKLIESIGAKR